MRVAGVRAPAQTGPFVFILHTDYGMGRSRACSLQVRALSESFGNARVRRVNWFHQASVGFSLVSKALGREDSPVPGCRVHAAG